MIEDKLANRYVEALISSLKTSQYQSVLNDLLTMDQLNSQVTIFKTIINSPRIDFETKEKIIDQLQKKLALSQETSNFVKVLTKNNRLFFLHKMVKKAQSLIYDLQKKIVVEMTAAVKITPELEKQVVEIFQTYTEKDVDISYVEDPTIIAGFKAQIGDNMIDATVQGQLQKIAKELVSKN